MGQKVHCPFCELPTCRDRMIADNEFVWAFPTNIPVVPGHTLIVPQRCIAQMRDLTPDEHAALFAMLDVVQDALVRTFGAEGFNIAWNEGGVAGQSVPHFHMHVLPRVKGDEGITEYEPRKFLYRPGSREPSPEAELQAVAEQVKNAIWKGR